MTEKMKGCDLIGKIIRPEGWNNGFLVINYFDPRIEGEDLIGIINNAGAYKSLPIEKIEENWEIKQKDGTWKKK